MLAAVGGRGRVRLGRWGPGSGGFVGGAVRVGQHGGEGGKNVALRGETGEMGA